WSRPRTRSRCRRRPRRNRCRTCPRQARRLSSRRSPAMSDPTGLVILIPLFPLLASALIAVLGYPLLRQYSHWPCIVAAALSCFVSAVLVTSGYGSMTVYYEWFGFGDARVDFALQVDGLTLIMLVTVTFVGTLIAIYSAGYMHGDPGYPRYFALVS